ncbi:type II toxin-antitoxin system tRNA(fMet)-specific endonuclease VapC [Sulfuricurvum sp.]|uniref:type II toxin-antitoxin system tRNA(fMet)-specific endonuclease VapC n=1 Tax=Sulfuricurvum sp. TaxID=2025608 RepID=UPI003C5AD66E
MLYMLDTNICSYIIRNKPQNIKEKLKSVEKDHTIALSTVVVSELIYGAKKKGAEKLFDLVLSFIENFQIMDFDKNSALSYATIRVELETTGNSIGSNDLFIAAHAKGCDAILVTNNTKEFERVEGLRLENWVC